MNITEKKPKKNNSSIKFPKTDNIHHFEPSDKAKSMSSPWKTPERPQAQSFRELMQEQKEDEVNNAEDRDIAMAIKLSMEENLSVEER